MTRALNETQPDISEREDKIVTRKARGSRILMHAYQHVDKHLHACLVDGWWLLGPPRNELDALAIIARLRCEIAAE